MRFLFSTQQFIWVFLSISLAHFSIDWSCSNEHNKKIGCINIFFMFHTSTSINVSFVNHFPTDMRKCFIAFDKLDSANATNFRNKSHHWMRSKYRKLEKQKNTHTRAHTHGLIIVKWNDKLCQSFFIFGKIFEFSVESGR